MSSCKGGENHVNIDNDDHVLCGIRETAWAFLKGGLERVQNCSIPDLLTGDSSYDDIWRASVYSPPDPHNCRDRGNGSKSMKIQNKRRIRSCRSHWKQ